MIVRNPKELALHVKSYRKSKSISQVDISESVGIKQATVSSFERKPEATKLDTLFLILSAANLEIEIRPKGLRSRNNNDWQEEW